MERYKRTKSDSVLKCPYCERQFNVGVFKANQGIKVCKGCHKSFYYFNYSKAYCTKTGKRATYRLDELRSLYEPSRISQTI